MKNIVWIFIGCFLVLFSILLKCIFVLLRINKNDTTTPYCNGFYCNLILAIHRYSFKVLFIRMLFIYKKPHLTKEYLKILSKHTKVRYMGIIVCHVNLLTPQHDICTQHKHHQDRTKNVRKLYEECCKNPIIVVNEEIHDGHHRFDILKKYYSRIPCAYYISINS